MILAVLLFLLIGALFIVFIMGMVKPSLVMKWSKNPTRLKVFGIWIGSTIALWILMFIAIPTPTSQHKLANSQKYFDEGAYYSAKAELEDIQRNDSLYSKAQKIIKASDSLILIKKKAKEIADFKKQKEQRVEDSIKQEKQRIAKEKAEIAERESKRDEQIEQLNREIASIKKGVDFSTYRGTVDALQMELVLFGTWANLIEESEKYEDKEIQKLTKDLKNRVIRLQRSEFPKMRANYAKIFGEKLWRENIKVRANGTGKRYINFTGGLFASNANKEDFQKTISEGLRLYRFKQSRYRWYEGDDEYTYWEMETKSDSELVTF